MLRPEWRRISGLHIQDEGQIAAIWIAHDKDADSLHLYDCALFRTEVLAVIAEGLKARGKWIPIAWHKEAKDVTDKLLDRGCNMLPEHAADSISAAEVTSRDIWERMRTDRFKVAKQLTPWLDEYKSFYRNENKVPLGTHPLMSATRHAVSLLEYARPFPKKANSQNFPRIAMV